MIGQNVRKYRLQKNMSQIDMATTLNLARTAISHIENGTRADLDIGILYQIADLLKVSVFDLLPEETALSEDFQKLNFENQQIIIKMTQALLLQQKFPPNSSSK